jgi:hypothetical protein
MLNEKDKRLIRLFQESIDVGEVEPNQENYLEKFRSDIDGMGRVFQYLRLAKADNQSSLGWKPTTELLKMIAARKPHRPKRTRKWNPSDNLFLYLMLDIMLGEEHSPEKYFCCYVLTRIGLVLENVELDSIPTPDLVDRFSTSYHFGIPVPEGVVAPVLTAA